MSTSIPAAPRAFKNFLLTIGTDEFRAHVSSAQFTPSPAEVSWTGGDGTTHTDSVGGSTKLDIAVVQDWNTPESLINYLFDNAGQLVPVTLQYPNGGPTFAAEVTLVAPVVGGKVNEFNESTVSLPSSAPTKS